MKKISTYIMLLAIGSMSFVSCSRNTNKGIMGGGNSASGTIVKSVATAVGLILLSKIIASVLKTITTGNNSSFASLSQDKTFLSSFNEQTPINAFAKSDILKTALQAVVAQKYQIPFATMNSNFSKLRTVGDLATFIGENGSAKALTQIK